LAALTQIITLALQVSEERARPKIEPESRSSVAHLVERETHHPVHELLLDQIVDPDHVCLLIKMRLLSLIVGTASLVLRTFCT
jgi:hypothetical protein